MMTEKQKQTVASQPSSDDVLEEILAKENNRRLEPLIPEDRTSKQPLQWVCMRPECRNEESGKPYSFFADQPKCPKCTSFGPPAIQLKALVHLLVPDPAGKIKGMFGRYSLACDRSRDVIATTTNREGGSDHPDSVNCPGCWEAAKKLRVRKALGRQVTPEFLQTLFSEKTEGDKS